MTRMEILRHPLLPDVVIEDRVFHGLTLCVGTNYWPGWGVLFRALSVTIRNCVFLESADAS